MLKYTASLIACATMLPLAVSAQERPEDDVQGVIERQRPDFEAQGISAGAFMVQPGVSVEAVHDDNIFVTPNDEESDLITVIRPEVALKSRWVRHSVNVRAGAEIGQYSDFTSENYNDYHTGAGGRFDIQRGQYIEADYAYDRDHEDRSSPDDVNGREPTKMDVQTAKLGFTRDVSRISLQAGGQAQRIDYKHVDATPGVVITNAERDRQEYEGTVKLAYEYIPHYHTYVKGTYGQRQYDILSSVNRDSNGYSVVLGTDVNLTGKMKGDVYAGYITRDYDDPALDTIDNVDFGGSLLWNVTGLTSLRAAAARAIEETTQVGASGYLDSSVNVSVEHELRRNILLALGGGYTNQDFQGGTLDRSDDIYGGGAELSYLLPLQGVRLSAGYNYSERTSDFAPDEYTDNRFMLRLAGEL